MNVVDTSALVEYYLDTPLAETFAQPIEDREQLLVPSIVLFELYKILKREVDADMADEAVMALRECRIVDLDATHALAAAQLGPRHGLALADSIIYATAQLAGATLWTQDEHFEKLPGVRYFAKPSDLPSCPSNSVFGNSATNSRWSDSLPRSASKTD